ncbi:MAG: transposase [Clostridiales bacterium]|nr:transposase [Clostridiales bacterium]
MILYLACNFGRVGYRMVTNMLRNDGILINHKRVERIWRGRLEASQKANEKHRLWMQDGWTDVNIVDRKK